MSTKYKKSSEVPNSVLCQRLEELSEAVTRKGEDRDRELTLRIPAEVDRDADIVMSESARRIKQMETEISRLRGVIHGACMSPVSVSRGSAEEEELQDIRDDLGEAIAPCMDCGTESGIHHHNCGTLERD